jgi:hypothetical protein
MKTFFIIALFMAVAMAQVSVENHYEGSVPLPERKLEQSIPCLLAMQKAKIYQIASVDDVKDGSGGDMWRMEVALDQPLNECGAGVNGQSVNEIRHQVYFTSKDNEHKTPNKPNDPNSNQLSDATFARPLKWKEDQTDAEIAAAPKGWYEYSSKTAG